MYIFIYNSLQSLGKISSQVLLESFSITSRLAATICLLFSPSLFCYPPSKNSLFMHACLHTVHMCFLKTKSQTPEASVCCEVASQHNRLLLHPSSPLSTKIKTHREVALSVYTPSVHRPQQGLLIVTCACSAPSQSPVSQMHAGRSGPPPLDSSRVAGRL